MLAQKFVGAQEFSLDVEKGKNVWSKIHYSLDSTFMCSAKKTSDLILRDAKETQIAMHFPDS